MGRNRAKPDPGAVTRVAYELFLRRGREPGHDVEDRLTAERLLQIWARRRKAQGYRRREDKLWLPAS